MLLVANVGLIVPDGLDPRSSSELDVLRYERRVLVDIFTGRHCEELHQLSTTSAHKPSRKDSGLLAAAHGAWYRRHVHKPGAINTTVRALGLEQAQLIRVKERCEVKQALSM